MLRLTPERALARASRRFLAERVDRCSKCGSTFLGHEPAFVHCHYCGRMARIKNASLLAQELFELRSGMRLAS
ncbi:MAG: hypothetical protein HY727_20600 [Candidatus Rokubacteria bacterium]|nr:hypothetical protein [Candidatus Rokubacteria bacterium]